MRSLRSPSEITIGWHDESCKTKLGRHWQKSNGEPLPWSATNTFFYQVAFSDEITLRKITAARPGISLTLPLGWTDDPFQWSILHRWRPLWQWQSFGFKFGSEIELNRRSNQDGMFIRSYWQVPYWAVVLPITLLSAYLLLSNARKTTPGTSADTPPEKMK